MKSEQYLWDRGGEPDRDVQELEALLEPLRGHLRPAGAWLFAEKQRDRLDGSVFRQPWLAAAAAVAAIAVCIVWLPTAQLSPDRHLETAWKATRVDLRTSSSKSVLVHAGEWLVTDGSSTLKLTDSDVGELELAPESRLSVLPPDAAHERFALALGQVHAVIWAAPGHVAVDTPSAEAVDLGCEYTLKIDRDGRGLIAVSFGWVAFTSNGRESFVPEGAFCKTRPASGPDTPYFGDASPDFRHALDQLDDALDSGRTDITALDRVISLSRKQDALTLWHLLARVPESQRRQVYMRLATVVPPPTGVSVEAALQLDRGALDRWWNGLGLDDISVWRSLERPWRGAAH